MKKKMFVVLGMILTMALTGCGAKEAQKPVEETEKPAETQEAATTDDTKDGDLKFGYVVSDMSHEWYQNIVKGAQKRAEELGVELKVADCAMDVGKQVTQIENMLTEGVDVQLITPVDPKALANVMSEAESYGVPVISESNIIPDALSVVGIDNLTGGRSAGEWFMEYAKENGYEGWQNYRRNIRGGSQRDGAFGKGNSLKEKRE